MRLHEELAMEDDLIFALKKSLFEVLYNNTE
jgi:hypothetical protein